VRDPRPRTLDLFRTAALGAVVAIAVAACSSSAGAGWTFAPEPSATPAPSASGSAAPGGSAAAPSGSAAAPSGSAAAPSGSASAAPTSTGASTEPGQSPNPGGSNPAGGGTTGETTVRVTALNLAFDTQQIQAPGGQAFTIEFDNQDASIPHNIAIIDPSGAEAFKGDIITGPAKATYAVPALTKGTAYTFRCDVHPTTMTGTVVVQ
jgi:hypothetical protein